ncbi:MAG: site-specific integrase [bacterium]|nr:site-specific integrase [bacterium]
MTRQGATRKATKEIGVYELVSEIRIYKRKPDVCYYITYKFNGKKKWEKVGWLSEGYSIKLASDVRSERLRSIRHSEELPHQKKKAITIKILAEKYLDWSASFKTGGGKDDKSRYENQIKVRFEDKRLNEISPFDLERMKSDMTKAGSAPKTISHCLGLIRAMYNKAMDWNLYQGQNPVKKIKMPVIQNARSRFLSFEEANILLKELKRDCRHKTEYIELKDPKLHDIALISLHTGSRAGEIFNLKGCDIDFENGLITLRDTKNTETRYAPMTEKTREIFKRRMPSDLNCLIFTDKRGNKINEVANDFNRIVNRLKMNDGISDTRQRLVFHSLRHSFASWLAIQGTPLYTIAKLLGHKSISMSERYSHLSPDHKKQAINDLEGVLNGSGKVIVNIETVRGGKK